VVPLTVLPVGPLNVAFKLQRVAGFQEMIGGASSGSAGHVAAESDRLIATEAPGAEPRSAPQSLRGITADFVPLPPGPDARRVVVTTDHGGAVRGDRAAWVRRRRLRPGWPWLVSDFVCLSLALVVGLFILAGLSNAPDNALSQLGSNLAGQFTFPFVGVVSLGLYGLYSQQRRRFRPTTFGDLAKTGHAVAVAAFLTLGFGVLIHRATGLAEVNPAQLAATALTALVAVLAGRACVRSISHGVRGRAIRVLVVGSGMMAQRIGSYFTDDPGVDVVGAVDDDPVPGHAVLGGIDDLPDLCERLAIDRVLIGFSRTHPSETIERLRALHGQVAISVVPRYFELLSCRSQVEEISGLPVIDVAPPHLSPSARLAKRTVDVVGAAVGLLVLSPVLLASALAIKVSSKGPVLFRQVRQGQDGRPFTMYKLRSMETGAEQQRASLDPENEVDGPLFKMRDDPRVFPIGTFLRHSSFDEIPQLFNVLRGDMSLVGPRPFILEEAEQIDGWAARRFEVRPGITGLWQVSGRNDLTFDDLRRLDYVYVASWSLWWDMRIMWHTPASVLRRRGAY